MSTSPEYAPFSWPAFLAVVAFALIWCGLIVYAFTLHVEDVTTPDPVPSVSFTLPAPAVSK